MSDKPQYREVKHLHLPEIDREILAFWNENQIFDKSISTREGNPTFVFFEGPPSTNGLPGIHHVMGRTIKDLFCRYQTLKGKQVSRKGGWDTHGLPIELNVEKSLGIRKDDIGVKISVEDYNKHCRQDAMRYIDIWNDVTEKMGYWVDMDNPYITYENEYIESLWWLLQQFYSKGLLYKGYSIQPYSPAAGTGLSSHEVNQPGCYREITDTTVVAMFKVINNIKSAFLFDDDQEDLRILAWTTTPWTLPSNTALTVGPKINYVKIKTTNPYTHQKVSVVLAESLVEKWFGAKNQPSIDEQSPTFTGKQLQDITYEQLLPFGNNIEPLDGATDAFRVILGDFVTTEDGTGVVHTAPSFGADDRKAARAAGIGTLTLVDKQGKFIDTVGEFSGRYVKDYLDDPNYVSVDVDIAVRLKLDNKALNVQKYEHNYPHCWRTDKPILYYPLDSWFIAASKYRDRMSELNQTINWKPATTGEGRFQNWLENIQDWNLSRSRYWGCPLPIWRTADSSSEICIGSLAQLQTEIDKANSILGLNQTMPPDLHRPYIDNITLVSDKGEPMKRELDLIDVWFDSGAMPYAQWHYPFSTPPPHSKITQTSPLGEGWEGLYPADFIAEGVDQTRGWFYTLHAISVMLFDSVAYKNVVSNGLLLDENGVKMSKRLGNVVDPFVAMDKYGADTVRWYIISNSNPWDNLKFSWKKEWNEDKTELIREYSLGMEEVRNKFLGTLYNTYSFFALYANIDGFNYSQPEVPLANRPEIDRWILSLLNSLVKKVDSYYATYDATPAARLIQEFVSDHLSNWYVRLCRRRFWKGDMGVDKLSAYQTLYRCLEVVCQLASPIAPFITDFIFRNLNNTSQLHTAESVHLSQFPIANNLAIDTALEERMMLAQTASSLVLALRKKADIKVRQPLQKILVPVLTQEQKEQFEQIEKLILAEVNVKEIQFVHDTSGIVTKSIKPDLKKLGKKLGGKMKAVTTALAAFSQEDIKTIEQGSYDFNIDGETITVLLDEVLITSEDIKGWMVNSDKGVTVALDVNITPELAQEGIARELINRLQNLRKISNFNVTDRINVQLEQNELIANVIENTALHQYICSEVLADSLMRVNMLNKAKKIQLDINGELTHVNIATVKAAIETILKHSNATKILVYLQDKKAAPKDIHNTLDLNKNTLKDDLSTLCRSNLLKKEKKGIYTVDEGAIKPFKLFLETVASKELLPILELKHTMSILKFISQNNEVSQSKIQKVFKLRDERLVKYLPVLDNAGLLEKQKHGDVWLYSLAETTKIAFAPFLI